MGDWKFRRNNVIKSILTLCGVGMLYAFITTVTPFRIPCVIKETTGFYCPGCGMTRMCLALLRFDFVTAFRCNQLLFLMLPVIGGIVLLLLYRYIRYGTVRTGKALTGVLVVLIVLFVIFGVVRNLPGMERLQPPAV